METEALTSEDEKVAEALGAAQSTSHAAELIEAC